MTSDATENEYITAVYRRLRAYLKKKARLDRTQEQQASGIQLNDDQLALVRNKDQVLAPLKELEALAAHFASLSAKEQKLNDKVKDIEAIDGLIEAQEAQKIGQSMFLEEIKSPGVPEGSGQCIGQGIGKELVWMLVRFLRHASITRHVPTGQAAYDAAVERVLQQVYEADLMAVNVVEKLYMGVDECIDESETVTYRQMRQQIELQTQQLQQEHQEQMNPETKEALMQTKEQPTHLPSHTVESALQHHLLGPSHPPQSLQAMSMVPATLTTLDNNTYGMETPQVSSMQQMAYGKTTVGAPVSAMSATAAITPGAEGVGLVGGVSMGVNDNKLRRPYERISFLNKSEIEDTPLKDSIETNYPQVPMDTLKNVLYNHYPVEGGVFSAPMHYGMPVAPSLSSVSWEESHAMNHPTAVHWSPEKHTPLVSFEVPPTENTVRMDGQNRSVPKNKGRGRGRGQGHGENRLRGTFYGRNNEHLGRGRRIKEGFEHKDQMNLGISKKDTYGIEQNFRNG